MNIEDCIDIVNKIYPGALAPVKLSDIDCYDDMIYRDTGCSALNWVLANHSDKGGLPRGRIIEISGPEGCGKTTAATVMAAQIQKYKKANRVAIFDYEHKFNIPYAIQLGLDINKTIFCQPKGVKAGVAGMSLMAELMNAEDCGLIIIDSIVAVPTIQEMEGNLEDANIGALARLQSRALMRTNNSSHNGSPTLLLINQIRDNIGGYGSSEKTSGARAIKFYAIARIDVRAQSKITDKDDVEIGQKVKFKAHKCQCGRPFGEEVIDIYFGDGYHNIKWIIEKASDLKVTKTLAKTNSRPTSILISFPEGDEIIPKSQLTEWLSKKKNFTRLYSWMITENTRQMKEKEDIRKASKGMVEESKEEESSKEPVDLSDDQEEESKAAEEDEGW